MKNTQDLIGKKVKGFKFDKSKPCGYNDIMDKFIGKIGVIYYYFEYNNSFLVKFEDCNNWSYPADQIEDHLVENEEAVKEEIKQELLKNKVLISTSDIEIQDEIPTFTKEDLREAYKIGFNLIMSKSRKESDKHFERWYKKTYEPTKEEQLTAIIGSSEKVSEIMELFNDKN